MDALAAYLTRLHTQFRENHGKDPRFVEIAAGDGLLSSALNRRLKPLGIHIRATDIGDVDDLGTIFPPEVEMKEGAETAQEADIILGSWWPARTSAVVPFDLQVLQNLAANPEKTLVLVNRGEALTNSRSFWNFLEATPSKLRSFEPRGINYTRDGEELATPWYFFSTSLSDLGATRVTVFRSAQGKEIPDLRPEHLPRTEAEDVRWDLQNTRRLRELLQDESVWRDFRKYTERGNLQRWLNLYLNSPSPSLRSWVESLVAVPEGTREGLKGLSEAYRVLQEAGTQAPYELLNLLVERGGREAAGVLNRLPKVWNALAQRGWSGERRLAWVDRVSHGGGERTGQAFDLTVEALEAPLIRKTAETQNDEALLSQIRDYWLFKTSLEAQRGAQRRQVGEWIPKLRETALAALSLSPPESLSDWVEHLQNLPYAENIKINRLRSLAIQASKEMDIHVWGDFRKTIHNYPSRENIRLIERYLEKARQMDSPPPRVIPLLEEALKLAGEIYNGKLNLAEAKASLSPRMREQLRFPASETPNREEISEFAVSVREAWDEFHNGISMADAEALSRIAVSLQRYALSCCSLNNHEMSLEEAEKLSTLIAVLYGSGYGHEGWLALSRTFRDSTRRWRLRLEERRSDPGSRGPVQDFVDEIQAFQREIKIQSALAYEIALQVQDHYHDHLDPLAENFGQSLGLNAEEKGLYSSNQYRSMAVFLLAQHLNQAHIPGGNPEIARQVLHSLGRENLLAPPELTLKSTPRPFFYGETDFPENLHQVGGKALGLSRLTRWKPGQVPAGFVLPARPAGYRLNAQEVEALFHALVELENRTGKAFGEGLRVSVRSGAALSMPGTMETRLNVESFEDVLRQVEAVYESWNHESARAFRLRNGVPDSWGTAVNVVAMIDGTRDPQSGAGIALSWENADHAVQIAYGRQVSGEELVKGYHPGKDPLPSPELEEELRLSIREFEQRWGEALGLAHPVPIEVEFTVESGRLYFLQIRRAHLSPEEEVAWTARKVREGVFKREEAVRELGGRHRLQRLLSSGARIDFSQSDNALLYRGEIGVGPPVSGQLAFNADQISAILQQGSRAIYATDDPDAEASYKNGLFAGAALVAGGNPLSHLVTLTKSTPQFTYLAASFRLTPSGLLILPGERAFRQGTFITLDPARGNIYEGPMEIIHGESPAAEDIRFILGK
ncbi:MAG: PEP/pyruvate-binding domain-containing protein [bacterium]